MGEACGGGGGVNRAPRILEAQAEFVGSYDPDADARPARPNRSQRPWPPTQPADALEAACRAGFDHFIRDPDPARRDRRWAALSPKAKDARAKEFLVQLTAYKAAGGR